MNVRPQGLFAHLYIMALAAVLAIGGHYIAALVVLALGITLLLVAK